MVQSSSKRFSFSVSSLGREVWQSPLLFVLVWVPALSAFILALNPALTADLTLLARVGFWVLHVALLLPLLMFLQVVVDDRLAAWDVPAVIQLAIAAICASVIFAPVSIVLDLLFEPAPDLGPDPTALMLLFDEILSLLGPSLCVWLLVNAARLQNLSVPLMGPIERSGEQSNLLGKDDPSPEVVPDTSLESAFWSKVPPELGRDVISLSAEQHYLHVTTTKGRSLILFPIGRAAEALSRMNGLLIHRSHWVALAHVVAVDTSRDATELVLSNAERLPVSRRKRNVVQEAVKRFGIAQG